MMVEAKAGTSDAVAACGNPERRRLGDRIARTCVVQKERVPVLA